MTPRRGGRHKQYPATEVTTANTRERRSSMDVLKFKGYCAANKIKSDEICKLLGLTPSTVSAKMNGRRQFTLTEVRTLCEHYKISADEYFV